LKFFRPNLSFSDSFYLWIQKSEFTNSNIEDSQIQVEAVRNRDRSNDITKQVPSNLEVLSGEKRPTMEQKNIQISDPDSDAKILQQRAKVLFYYFFTHFTFF
jgi:hypothetical protein